VLTFPTLPWLTRAWNHPARPYVLIALLAILAHPSVLRTPFFMDDYGHIVTGETVAGSEWHIRTWRWLTYLIWAGTYQVFGMNPVAFHVWNLVVHIGIGSVLYRVARDFYEKAPLFKNASTRETAALLGALVFTCHPLGSEPVHYAACLTINLVTFFTVVTAWVTFRLARNPSPLWLLATILAVGLTACSKQPGFGHAVCTVAIVLLAFADWSKLAGLRRHFRWKYVAWSSPILIAMAVVVYAWAKWIVTYVVHQPDLINHAWTQGRLFWSYLARVIWPGGYSVDHYVAWSVGPQDGPALLGSIALLLAIAGASWLLFQRKYRLTGMILCLALAPLCLRFAYVVRELLVEYRTYPSLPWIGLLFGGGIVWLYERRNRVGIAAAASVIVVFTAASMFRSPKFEDPARLFQESLARYPMNVRALSLLQREAALKENWVEVGRLMPEVEAALRANEQLNAKHPWRKFELNRAYHHYAEAHQYVAVAIAKSSGPASGLAYANDTIEKLDRRYPGHYRDPKTGKLKADNPLVVTRAALAQWAMQP